MAAPWVSFQPGGTHTGVWRPSLGPGRTHQAKRPVQVHRADDASRLTRCHLRRSPAHADLRITRDRPAVFGFDGERYGLVRRTTKSAVDCAGSPERKAAARCTTSGRSIWTTRSWTVSTTRGPGTVGCRA